MTLEWFESDLLNSGNPADRPRWMDSWVHFVAELQSTFGPHDPVADAEHQLEHLRMKDSYRVTRYIVDFNRLALQVQDWRWGAPSPILLRSPRSPQGRDCSSRKTPDSEWAASPLSRDRRALLGEQRRDLSHDEDPVHLIPNQALQLQRQLIQLRSGEIQGRQPIQLHLWLVQDD